MRAIYHPHDQYSPQVNRMNNRTGWLILAAMSYSTPWIFSSWKLLILN